MIYLIFSSIEFLLWFLPIFLIVYGITPHKYRNLTLLIGSIVFYAMGDAGNLAPLMISVLCNYFIGLHLAKRSPRTLWRKRLLFVTALSINIGILIWFKCRGGSAGLPLGISFYTFQILSYLIDVYRGDADREYSFLKFATYVVMFPKLISGPITRYGEVKDSLYNRTFTMQGLEDGMKLFVLGLAAKVLLADRVGILWHEVQVTGFESISTPLAWLAAIAYSMEIYFDFCGYSLMAMGLGRMLGIELPRNFRRPYMARGVRDFYRRWHMTLGSWFRDYVYFPMGGSRCGKGKMVFNLVVVWLLTGLWHGEGVNFLLWGAILGLLIIMEKLWYGKYLQKLPVLGHIYLVILIPLSWVVFAITDPGQLGTYFCRLFPLLGNGGVAVNAQDIVKYLQGYGGLLAIGIVLCIPAVFDFYEKHKKNPVVILMLFVLFWISIYFVSSTAGNPFMYLNF